MAPKVPATVKFFTPAYVTSSVVNKSGSFCEKPCCLIINRGQLVSVGLVRNYVEKKNPDDEEGVKPVLEVDELANSPSDMEKLARAENSEGKSMEKQEELKKRPDPKPEATDS